MAKLWGARDGGEADAALDGQLDPAFLGPDDYESQPSGDVGDPIACAVIE